MDEKAHFAVGIDVGTSTVRAVVGNVERDGSVNVVGYGEAISSGMRKGSIANLAGPAAAIDACLKPAEDMSGAEINRATLSVNGVHIMSTKTSGMVVVGMADHEIDENDLARVENVASTGKIPENRDILSIVAYGYKLDDQGGIKNPLGMKGMRLEVEANVLSNLKPLCVNLKKAAEMAQVRVEQLVPTVVAAARAVLTEKQLENGVGLVEIGAKTTGVAVYDGGDLQYVGVVPIGVQDITNDLAMILGIVPELAEKVKLRFATGRFGVTDKDVVLKEGREEFRFSREEVDSVVEARLEEIFDGVQKELKKAGYQKRLPEGLVLTGGGARMKDIDVYAREQVGLAVRIGIPKGFGGLVDAVARPEYAVAVGLMLMSADYGAMTGKGGFDRKDVVNSVKSGGWLKKLFGFFK